MPADSRGPDLLPVLKPRTNQRRKTVWQEAATRLLQSQMKLKGVSYKRLAQYLGGGESDQALMTRINRGTFSVAFFLQVMRLLGADSINVEHLPKRQEEPAGKQPRRPDR